MCKKVVLKIHVVLKGKCIVCIRQSKIIKKYIIGYMQEFRKVLLLFCLSGGVGVGPMPISVFMKIQW